MKMKSRSVKEPQELVHSPCYLGQLLHLKSVQGPEECASSGDYYKLLNVHIYSVPISLNENESCGMGHAAIGFLLSNLCSSVGGI